MIAASGDLPFATWPLLVAAYFPKYTGPVWSLILLSQLGARIEMDARIVAAWAYIMQKALAGGGQFSTNGAPSGSADCLQGVLCEALVGPGYGRDFRLANALELIQGKQYRQGRWPMEYSYTGKTWLDFGANQQPDKRVTLRARRVLEKAESVIVS